MIQYALPYSSHHLDLSQLIPPWLPVPPPHPSPFINLSLLCSDSGSAVTPASPSHASAVRPRIHHWQEECWKSEISRCLNILTWNLCWWWLPLPSSDPSVASLPERTVSRDIDTIRISLWSTVFLFSLALSHFLSSKDFWVTFISRGGLCRRIVSPFVRQSLLSQQSKRLEAKSSRLITLILWLSQPFLRGAY